MNGDLKTVRALVRQAADVNAAQPDGMTALHWAVERRDLAMMNVLLEAGAKHDLTNRTGAKPLYLAAMNGDAAAIARLLDAGEDANAVLTAEGETVLMLTSHTGNPEAVKLLLDRGADPNTQQVRGQTALMWAAAEGHADVVKLLLARGADPALVVGGLDEARAPAAGRHDGALVRGAPRQARSRARAARRRRRHRPGRRRQHEPALIADRQRPLRRGVAADRARREPEHRRRERPHAALRGDRPAQRAVVAGARAELPQATHLAMITKLLDAGADPSIKMTGMVGHRGSFDMRWSDLEGGTAFSRAAWNGDIEVMRLLLARGADPNVVTEKGETALLLLAGAGWPLGRATSAPRKRSRRRSTCSSRSSAWT